ARAAAKRARDLAEAEEVGEEIYEQARDFLTDVQQEEQSARQAAEEAERDGKFVLRLDGIGEQQLAVKPDDKDFDRARAAPLYADAFRAYGIDVVDVGEASRVIRQRTIRIRLVTAL